MKKKIVGICLLCTLLSGCASDKGISFDMLTPGNTEETESADTGFKAMGPGVYDSADTAVVKEIRQEEQKITFFNLVVNRNYTLNFDGTTIIYDKYGGSLSAAQLKPGDIVDVTFRKVSKKCVGIQISNKAWEYGDVKDFEISQARKQISFAGEQYAFTEDLLLVSGDETIELMDLNEQDVLSVHGIENTVYSIQVEKGHGYLRLENEEYFVDGWIEVGSRVIRRVTEDMLLAVPEGSYQVVLRNGKHGGVKEVTINRDEETLLDVGDLKGEEIKTGNVFFTVNPPDAAVYIDGKKVDTAAYVPLEYGIHQMIVRAAGYETMSQYIRVGQENANLNVEMEPQGSNLTGKDSSKNEEAVSDNDYSAYDKLPLEGAGEISPPEGSLTNQTEVPGVSQGDNQVTAGTGGYYVKVNAPINVEVYVDSNYVGIAPVKFEKKEGTHVISLRKNGYQTRSYTIQVDGEKKDMDISFSELVSTTNLTGNLTGNLAENLNSIGIW